MLHVWVYVCVKTCIKSNEILFVEFLETKLISTSKKIQTVCGNSLLKFFMAT